MKTTHYENILGILIELKEMYPGYTIAKHLSTALEGNFWGMTDQQLFAELHKYKSRLQLDIPHKDDEIDQIIKDGMNLHKILEEDEDGDY